MKFKIGDKVRLMEKHKSHKGYPSFTYNRKICTISDVSDTIYGFKEDIEAHGRAHWCFVEDKFEIAQITNWKGEINDT